VLLILILIPLYLIFTPPAPPAPLSKDEEAKVDASLAEKRVVLKQIARNRSEGKKEPFTLVLREAEINRLLETDQRLQDAMHSRQVSKAWVRISNGRVHATAIRNGDGPSSLTVNVIPEIGPNNALAFKIEGVDLGRLGVPTIDSIQRVAQKAISLLNDKSMIPEATFDSVKAEDGAITLSGKSK